MSPSVWPDRPAPASPQSGFTLLELLVALVLIALISTVLAGGVRFGARVWERSHVQSESVNEVHAIRRFLRERALSVRPAREIGADTPEGGTSFSGNAAALRLVTLMPAYVARGGLYHFEVNAAPSGMAVKRWPYGASESGPGAGQRRVLDGVKDIRFSFFGAPEASGATAWHDDWPGGGDFPRLISIKVNFPEGDTRVWPELIVALPASDGRTLTRRRN